MPRWNASSEDSGRLVEAVKQISHPLENNASLDPLIDQIGDARYVVPDAMEHSWEDVLHRTEQSAFYVLLRDQRSNECINAERGNRAIGVVYNPTFERYGNYVTTHLPYRYDAFAFIDETQAVHPLRIPVEEEVTVPDTYPWGL